MLTTSCNWLATALLSPPWLATPQVTSEPSARSAVKAEPVENTCVTSIVPSSAAATALLSPPRAGITPSHHRAIGAQRGKGIQSLEKHLRHVDRAIEFCRHGAAVAAVV
jgi:hypothetical protein